MLVRGACEREVQQALSKVNEEFGDNIKFGRFDHAGMTRDHKDKWLVLLRTVCSKGPGSRRSARNRRTNSACWHMHGKFIDALPAGAEVITNRGKGGKRVMRPGDQWEDRDVGSMVQPAYESELCDC